MFIFYVKNLGSNQNGFYKTANLDSNLDDFCLHWFQRNAVSTYNILNEEGRVVAAALLPYGVSS